MEIIDFLLNDHLGRLLVAALLGSLLGLEREIARKDPSLRTFMLISLGSAMFAIVSELSVGTSVHGDPSRVSAQVVTGVGFLGAGAIFRSQRRLSGATTAALMWMAAGIGLAAGHGHLQLAFSAALISLFFNISLRFVHQLIDYLQGGHGPTDSHESSS